MLIFVSERACVPAHGELNASVCLRLSVGVFPALGFEQAALWAVDGGMVRRQRAAVTLSIFVAGHAAAESGCSGFAPCFAAD